MNTNKTTERSELRNEQSPLAGPKRLTLRQMTQLPQLALIEHHRDWLDHQDNIRRITGMGESYWEAQRYMATIEHAAALCYLALSLPEDNMSSI